MALHEKGLPFKSHWIDLHKFEQHDPAYLKINPEGQLPALVHQGEVITQTTVINEYLEDAFPDTPRLRPGDPLLIARMRQWNRYIDDVVMEAVSVHGWQTGAGAVARQYSDAEFERLMQRIPLEKQVTKWRTARAGFPQQQLDECTAKVEQAVARAESALSKGPWLIGDFFSLADINFYAYCGGALIKMFPAIGTDEKCPRLLDWIRRIEARPASVTALATKGPD